MEDKLIEAGKKVKLIVSDIDGTLLNSNRQLTQENFNAIQKAKEQKLLFTLCTGRIVSMLEYYIHALEIETPIITCNGAVIWDPLSQKAIFDVPMDREELMSMLEFCKFNQLDYGVFTLGTNYFSRNSVRLENYRNYNEFAKANNRPTMKLGYFDDDFHCLDGINVYKLLIYDKRPEQIKMVEERLGTLKKTVYTTSLPGLLDISEKSVNKGQGVQKLAELLKLQPEQVCTIGDFENDIPMLQFAGFSVAMGNALPHVKENAFYVTATNDESGLAQVMNGYILRK